MLASDSKGERLPRIGPIPNLFQTVNSGSMVAMNLKQIGSIGSKPTLDMDLWVFGPVGTGLWLQSHSRVKWWSYKIE